MDLYRPRVYGGSSASRITPSGPYFVDAAGALVIRRSLTAFTAPKRFATGRGDEARRYFDWAASKGFNELRVFARVDWTGPPGSGVESGWEYDAGACDQVLIEAAARGLRVEVVANTGPFGNGADDCANQLRRVDELCLRHDNALLEVWNEPQQNGGNQLVADVLARYTPRTPGWASGVYDQTPYPAGPAATLHTTRKDEWSRLFKDAWEIHEGNGPSVVFQPPYRGPVMLDEPPQIEQTIRDEGRVGWPAADDWRAYGAGAAFFACGATLHGNPDFQQCVIPTNPAVLACVDAFIAGFGDVPVQRFDDYNRGDPPSSNPGSRRYWRWDGPGRSGRKWEITVRPYGFRMVG